MPPQSPQQAGAANVHNQRHTSSQQPDPASATSISTSISTSSDLLSFPALNSSALQPDPLQNNTFQQNTTSDTFDEFDALVATPDDEHVQEPLDPDDHDHDHDDGDGDGNGNGNGNGDDNDDDDDNDDAMNGMILGLGETTADEHDWQLDALDHPFADQSASISLEFMNPVDSDSSMHDIEPQKQSLDTDALPTSSSSFSRLADKNSTYGNLLSNSPLELAKSSQPSSHFLNHQGDQSEQMSLSAEPFNIPSSVNPFSSFPADQSRPLFAAPTQPADVPVVPALKPTAFSLEKQNHSQRIGSQTPSAGSSSAAKKQESTLVKDGKALKAEASLINDEHHRNDQITDRIQGQQRRQLTASAAQQQKQVQLQRQQLDAARLAVDNAQRNALSHASILSPPGLVPKSTVGSVPLCRYCGRIVMADSPNALNNHEQACQLSQVGNLLSPSKHTATRLSSPSFESGSNDSRIVPEITHQGYFTGLSKSESEQQLNSDYHAIGRESRMQPSFPSSDAIQRLAADKSDQTQKASEDSGSELVSSTLSAPDRRRATSAEASTGTSTSRRDSELVSVVRRLVRTISTLDIPARLCLRDALLSLSHKAANPSLRPTPEQEAMNRAAEYLVLRMLFLTGQHVMHSAPGTVPAGPAGTSEDDVSMLDSSSTASLPMARASATPAVEAAISGLPGSSGMSPKNDNEAWNEITSSSQAGSSGSPSVHAVDVNSRHGQSHVSSDELNALAQSLRNGATGVLAPTAPSGLSPGSGSNDQLNGNGGLNDDAKMQTM